MSKNEKSNKVLKKPSQLTQHYHNALNPKKYSNKCVTINFRWKKVGEKCVSIMFPIWKRFFPQKYPSITGVQIRHHIWSR
jgi:hypothetical protein